MVRELRWIEHVAVVLAAIMAIAAAPSAEEESAIRAAAKSYVTALARGDAKAIADLWTADGDSADEHGTVTKGRDAADLAVPSSDGDAGHDVDIKESALRMLTPDCAIEDGSVSVVPPGSSTPLTGHYTASTSRASPRAPIRSPRSSPGPAAWPTAASSTARPPSRSSRRRSRRSASRPWRRAR